MDFEVIDSTYGDSIAKGDIISENGSFIQITEVHDDGTDIEAYGHNLSTGDDWDNLLMPHGHYDIYRSY